MQFELQMFTPNEPNLMSQVFNEYFVYRSNHTVIRADLFLCRKRLVTDLFLHIRPTLQNKLQANRTSAARHHLGFKMSAFLLFLLILL